MKIRRFTENDAEKVSANEMKQLLLLDAKNYDEDMEELVRTAVRGIIFVGDKLLLIEDNKGEVKLPGGGQEAGESDADTLIREIREETGCNVIPETIRPFGYIEEKRKGINEDRRFHQFSRLYFCEVADERGETEFSVNEKRYGMRFKAYTLDEAIAKNRAMLDQVGELAWNQREYKTLLLIKANIWKVEITLMNKREWLFFDIGSTLVDESIAYQNRIKKTIAGSNITYSEFMDRLVQLEGDFKRVCASFGLKPAPWNSDDEVVYIDTLWVDSKYRGKGLGAKLLAEIEKTAKAKGCYLIHLDTFDFQAKEFYEKQGYEVFGVLEDCPKCHCRYYLKKAFSMR